MRHHELCPISQTPDIPLTCLCIQLETAERDARADERNRIVQMLRYNTIISIWLTAGDEQQRKEAEFVLHRISGYPEHCDPRRSCASRTDGHWEACHAATPE